MHQFQQLLHQQHHQLQPYANHMNSNSSNNNMHQLHQLLHQHGSSLNNPNSNANNQIVATHGSSGINNVVPNRAANSRNISNSCGRGNPDIMKRPIK